MIRIGTDCSGIEAPIQALKKLKIPYKHEFASEVDKFARESLLANYNPKTLHKDMTKSRNLPKIDMYVCGFPCFLEGTKVLTDSGYKPIENINIDDKLMSHNGVYQNIVNLQKKNFTGTVYKIRAKYHPEPLLCTEEHPFYIREKDTLNNFTKPKWVKAKELTNKHYFGMVINKNENIPEFNFEIKTHKYATKKIHIKLDKLEHWFMMGYFLGDGWIEETLKKDGRQMNKIRFAINNTDEEYVTNEIRKIMPITDKKCDSGKKCKKFGCQNLTWFNIFKDFGKYAHGKKIPEWVQDAPKKYIKEFIRGYKTADGCLTGNSHSFTTVSYNIAFGLQRLYLKLGEIVSIMKTKRPPTCIIEGRVVNQRDTYKIVKSLNLEKKYTTFIEDDYVWFRLFKDGIKKIEKNDISVYNFEVENDNSYIVENIIVHNCQPFSLAGKRRGSGDKRGNIFLHCIKTIKQTNPSLFILENVKGILSAEKGEYWKQIQKSLNSLKEYNVYASLLNTRNYGIPQNRTRIYIVGIKKSKKKYEFEFPKYVKMKSIESYVDKKDTRRDRVSPSRKNAFNKFKGTFVDFKFINRGLPKPEYSPVICALSNMWCAPMNRKATVKELLSLQGFPKNFKQVVSDTQMKKQIGNSMSVNVLEHLFKECFKSLDWI
jgi:site-specific DNA-cytosine methylase/intein/homing endonuclease